MEETLKEMALLLRAVRENQEVTNAKLDGIELRLSSLEGEAKATNARLDAIESEAKVTNTRLDGIEQRLSSLEGEVKGVTESVDYLVHKLGEHDRDLYVIKTKIS